MDSQSRGAPLVRNIPGRGLSRQVHAALDDARTVVLLSKRDTDLRRTLAALDRPVLYTASVRLGDGRTATTLSDSGTPAPYAWLMREDPAPVWRWACRVCDALDEGWSWPAAEGGDAAPMVRRRLDRDSLTLVDVPWS